MYSKVNSKQVTSMFTGGIVIFKIKESRRNSIIVNEPPGTV